MTFKFIKKITQAILKNNDQKDLLTLANGQVVSIGENGISVFKSQAHHDQYTTDITCKQDPKFVKFF